MDQHSGIKFNKPVVPRQILSERKPNIQAQNRQNPTHQPNPQPKVSRATSGPCPPAATSHVHQAANLDEDMMMEEWDDDDFNMEEDDMLLLSAAESAETAVQGRRVEADSRPQPVARVVPTSKKPSPPTNRKSPKNVIQTSIDTFMKPKKARVEVIEPDFDLEDDLELFDEVHMPADPVQIAAEPFVYLSEVKKKSKECPEKRFYVTIKVTQFLRAWEGS